VESLKALFDLLNLSGNKTDTDGWRMNNKGNYIAQPDPLNAFEIDPKGDTIIRYKRPAPNTEFIKYK